MSASDKRRVERCDEAPSPLLRSTIAKIDAVDCWATPLLPGDPVRPEEWTRRLFARPSRLLRLRDAVVRPLGLKSTAATRGPQTGFPLVASTEMETVIGVDDSHLDFRVGLAVHDRHLHVTTVVDVHNWIGASYWSIVRRVHPFVVRRLIASTPQPTTIERLDANDARPTVADRQ